MELGVNLGLEVLEELELPMLILGVMGVEGEGEREDARTVSEPSKVPECFNRMCIFNAPSDP
jgi:hypothetical protein